MPWRFWGVDNGECQTWIAVRNTVTTGTLLSALTYDCPHLDFEEVWIRGWSSTAELIPYACSTGASSSTRRGGVLKMCSLCM